jgi:hypothetical protein
VDEWIVFDVTQYTRKSWLNRNRVLHPGGGWQYVSIALANPSTHTKISEARIGKFGEQEAYVLGKISHYKRRAPHYAQTCEIVRSTFSGLSDDRLVSLNVAGLRTVCHYLGLPFRYRICSQLDIEWPELTGGQWAPWICAKLAADTYINPVGGRSLFDPGDFARAGVRLEFLDFVPFTYGTSPYEFEKDLSILDVLMWNSPDTIAQAIRQNACLIPAEASDEGDPCIVPR